MADQDQKLKQAAADRLHEALDYAISIIESYQTDIRNSSRFGVDLAQLGFCQGEVYQKAIEDIRHKAGL